MNTLPDLFGAAYLINLPKRVDRLKAAKRQLERVHWDADDVRVFSALRFAEPGGFPSAPVRGCFQSHLACLRRAQAEGRQSALIMEDDIAFTSALPRLTEAIKSQLAAQPWDFVYFGYEATNNISQARQSTATADLRFEWWTDDILAAHFYAVSGRILPRLIAHLDAVANGRPGDQEMGPMPVDGAYNIFRRKNPDVHCLIAYPRLGWQSSSRSDITPHLLDRVTFLRPVNSFLRRFKRMGRQWGA
jgi:GR25 family glycosyltransferase involved in LPS biosynthesis